MNYSSTARAGDLAQLVGLTHKQFVLTLKTGGDFQSHRGVLKHDDLIGKPWGSHVFSHTGAPFFLLQPSISDLLNDLPRTTQILYPKDIGYILIQMSVASGQTVMEAGTGSGSMTIALASAVGAEGKVISYEQKQDVQNLARKNIERLGLASRVDFKLRDIQEGLDEADADAFFLDVQNPYNYIGQVRAALKPGGFFGTLLPTFNQVEKTLNSLKKYNFAFVEVCELLLRYYKPDPHRIRPTDRMVAHTGFLMFARKIEPGSDPRGIELANEVGMEEET
ncbi:MAG: tRNA (adenine-N1)-methyltransferase [Anaerolineales bacterium]|nr:tRNA (adenine-N1)-methyltransferase [Anaerolineales bacterium]